MLTGDISLIKITSETSVSSGVRRIEAITADTALAWYNERSRILDGLSSRLNISESGIEKRIDQLLNDYKQLQKENEKLRLSAVQSGSGASSGGAALWEKAQSVKGLQFVAETVAGMNVKLLRTVVDQVRDKLKEKAIVAIASEESGRTTVCLGITKDLVGKLSCRDMIPLVASAIEGTGGGKPDFAQAGGSNAAGIETGFKNLKKWLEENA